MKQWTKWIRTLLGALLLVLLVRYIAFTSVLIPDNGMANSLLRGDRVLVNRWSYGWRTPMIPLLGYHRIGHGKIERKDIVLFNSPIPTKTPLKNRQIVDGQLFINRCYGLPGDTIYLDSLNQVIEPEELPDYKQQYAYNPNIEDSIKKQIEFFGIKENELLPISDSIRHIRSFSHYEYYLLTDGCEVDSFFTLVDSIQIQRNYKLAVPNKGAIMQVTSKNRILFCNTLRLYEKVNASIKNDSLFIDGKYTSSCIFNQDYYWMRADNSINKIDSSTFGLLPASHIIGKATCILFSISPQTGWRDKRILKAID
ncbi:MAG: signal peptidase I [Bacteroidaceae bacterium]